MTHRMAGRLLATQAPYGVRVDVMDGGTLSRTGMVSSVDAGADGAATDSGALAREARYCTPALPSWLPNC